MMYRFAVIAVAFFIGCAHSPRSKARAECSIDAQTSLVQALSDAEPDQRMAMLETLVQNCPDETSLLQAMLSLSVVTPIELELPDLSGESDEPRVTELIVHLSATGLSIGDALAPLEQSAWSARLQELSAQAVAEDATPVLLIAAEPDVLYRDVVMLMTSAQAAGISQISFITSE